MPDFQVIRVGSEVMVTRLYYRTKELFFQIFFGWTIWFLPLTTERDVKSSKVVMSAVTKASCSKIP